MAASESESYLDKVIAKGIEGVSIEFTVREFRLLLNWNSSTPSNRLSGRDDLLKEKILDVIRQTTRVCDSPLESSISEIIKEINNLRWELKQLEKKVNDNNRDNVSNART